MLHDIIHKVSMLGWGRIGTAKSVIVVYGGGSSVSICTPFFFWLVHYKIKIQCELFIQTAKIIHSQPSYTVRKCNLDPQLGFSWLSDSSRWMGKTLASRVLKSIIFSALYLLCRYQLQSSCKWSDVAHLMNP